MAVAVAGGRPTGFEVRAAFVFLWMIVRLSRTMWRWWKDGNGSVGLSDLAAAR